MYIKEWYLLYQDWEQHYKGSISWWDFYTKRYLQFVRTDKQRNYQRNKDIVYHTKGTKVNKRALKYLIGDVKAPVFTLVDETGILYYTLDSYSAPYTERGEIQQIITPIAYVRIYMNDNLELVADVPIMLLGDTRFFIDGSGNLKYEINLEE